MKRGLAQRPENWKWSSFAHYATAVEGAMEIESQWTARRREQMGVVLLESPPFPHRTREGWGNHMLRIIERVGQPPMGYPPGVIALVFQKLSAMCPQSRPHSSYRSRIARVQS